MFESIVIDFDVLQRFCPVIAVLNLYSVFYYFADARNFISKLLLIEAVSGALPAPSKIFFVIDDFE